MGTKSRKRNAIHSGIGDNDDLMVKKPQSEDATEEFQYAARLRGKKRHETMIYPELPFEYGISYKGQTLETYNEKEYEFGINAHPEKTIGYRIEETKELPVKRLWEAEACFEGKVQRMNMKYAFNWKGKKATPVRNEVDYAVAWRATVTSKAISDARDFFTSTQGQFLGYGDSKTWKKHSSGYVYDYSNVGRFSGIIAKQYYKIENYEAEFDFKTVLATNDQHVGGNDDDIVGLIFKAKDNKNFYMMLWERDSRVKASWRAPDRLDGFNMLTSGESKWEDRVEADDCKSSSSMSSSEFSDYSNNKGWRNKHRRIYKVTNGVMKRVDTTSSSGTPGYSSSVKDLGNGKGWDLNELHSLKVNTIGRNVEIYARDNGKWGKIFDFDTDWEGGSFGLVNVSQSVQFHRISVKEKKTIEGRIPESGYNSSTSSSKSLGKAYNYCIGQAKSKAAALKKSDSNIDTNSVAFYRYGGLLKDKSKGTITDSISDKTTIYVKAGTHTEYRDTSGRVPSSGWFEFDGIGDYMHATNGAKYIKANDSRASSSDVTISSVTGEVYNDPKYNGKTGIVVASLNGQLIAHNYNAKDTGEIYKKCYIRCGIVEVTPDHRNYQTGLMVFSDIAKVFKDDYEEFFGKKEWEYKKATYELLKPIKKPSPLPPEKESIAGCVVEEPEETVEEEVVQCLNDFDFDGRKLIMWNCEFPIDVTTKLFEDKVFAYRGWTTFNPLINFTPNKWTTYKLIPIEATIDEKYDEIKWAGRSDYEKAPTGTKVVMRTTEWYKAIFTSDISNTGMVTSELNLTADIPAAPEQFWLPEAEDDQTIDYRMPDHFGVVHYLLDAFTNHPDVVMWFQSNASLTTESADKRPESLSNEGRVGMPIILTSNDTDKVVIHCKEDPQYFPWSSGKYIGYGVVNGKRPYWGKGSGKADMINVSTEVVFFPDNLVRESLEGPFIDMYDDVSPNFPRIKYKLHDENRLIDFYSDHTDAYVWYTDWYSEWQPSSGQHQATMSEVTEIDQLVSIDPMLASQDFNFDDTTIEKIEIISDNPYVKLWTEESKGESKGLLGSYYRFPLTSNVYEEDWRVTGDYKEWTQTYEIMAYMDKIEVPIKHQGFKIIEVKVGSAIIPHDKTNGWQLEDDMVKLNGTAIKAGMLEIRYSLGDVVNTFTLENNLGTSIEVYVNGVLLNQSTYSFNKRVMTIDKEELFLNDHVHIQSYEMNDFHDATRRHYLGEKQYTQLDFQEDVPANTNNPNYGDNHYEGSFCFNWGYGRPNENNDSGNASMASVAMDFAPKSMYKPEEIPFQFDIGMEVVYPVGTPIDISNFTGEWKQWDRDPILSANSLDGPGDWHGPPEEGFPEVTNLRNQSLHSGWYNPQHIDLTDYEFKFMVSARRGDDDMYGAIFKFDPETQNFYSFEWDGYWGLTPPAGGTGVRGMSIYKNICSNPADSGKARLNYSRKELAHLDISWKPGQAEEHEIKINSVGNGIKVWTDNTLRFNIKDNDDPFLKGAWGPVTVSQPDTYFWDFWMQTYTRVKYTQEEEFRKSFSSTELRPKITGDDPFFEVELDQEEMERKFRDEFNAYCVNQEINKYDVVSVEYFILNDTSEHEVYFKEFQKVRVLELTPSKLQANPLNKTSIQQAVEQFGDFDISKRIEITQDIYENWHNYKIEDFDVLTFTPADCNASFDIVSDGMEDFVRQFKLASDKVVIFTHDTGAASATPRLKKLLTEFGFTLTSGAPYSQGSVIQRVDNTFNYPYDLSGNIAVTNSHWNQVTGSKPIYKFTHEDRAWLSFIDNVYYSEAGHSLYRCDGSFNQQLSENEMKIWINLICRIAQWTPAEKPKMTPFGQSRLYATIMGQYPDVGEPNIKPLPFPDESDIDDIIPPSSSDANDGFTVSWNGYLYAPTTGMYKFRATVNDGFRLWVNGKSIIDEWHIQKAPEFFPSYEAGIYLEGGKWHPIRANYFENTGQALVRLHWAQPGKSFQRISPNYLTPYLGYKLFAQVKKARPLPWQPMIHNGYYYFGEKESYLYSEKLTMIKTPDRSNQILLSPRPQQGSPIIVRDNEGNNLRKVTFYDENWNLTLENKEVFHGNGYAKYYFNYKGIDPGTLKVKVNGNSLWNTDYIFHEEESAIEFMEKQTLEDKIELRYKLHYSYMLDMNSSRKDALVEKDEAVITLHENIDTIRSFNMEIIYEAAKETPFYKTSEVCFNPLLSHNHTGFLYLSQDTDQAVKELEVKLSSRTLGSSGKEKVLVTAKVVDSYNNPCPNKMVNVWRDGILIKKDILTNDAGEIYVTDTPPVPSNKISTYQVKCDSLIKEVFLNYFIENKNERHYLDVTTQKLSLLAGVDDTATIMVTLRDENWIPVASGKTIKAQFRNTFGTITNKTYTTDNFGRVVIPVSGTNEKHGTMNVKISYDMGFEETANYVNLRVIGG